MQADKVRQKAQEITPYDYLLWIVLVIAGMGLGYFGGPLVAEQLGIGPAAEVEAIPHEDYYRGFFDGCGYAGLAAGAPVDRIVDYCAQVVAGGFQDDMYNTIPGEWRANDRYWRGPILEADALSG